jgi:putative serine protease PepD
VWPVVSVLALVIGVIGGMFGGAAYENWHTSSTEGQVRGGLADVGTESRAPLRAGNHSVASVAQRLLPSTVQVLAEYQGKQDGATGSGFVLDRSGHYITNNHVVADAVEHDGPIEVVDQNGDKYDAKVVGRSPTYDLAVLYVKGGPALPPASLGSARVLHVGDQVVAFGSPLGLSSTVTAGIVSALNRPVTTSDTGSTSSYINAVQTDAAINPGNSGGALVDVNGNLIGINTLIFSRSGGYQGIGFAIPVSIAKKVMEQIIETGTVTRGWFGVDVADISPELAESLGLKGTRGAIVGGIERGSPADRSGMKLGDVIIAVNGVPVVDVSTTLNAIAAIAPGKSVPVKVVRRNQELNVDVIVGKRRPRPRAE